MARTAPPVRRAAAPHAPSAASSRGHAARERLLLEATRVFARKGYAAASTREICEAAGANVSAIVYYFGGKAGLYREVLVRPVRGVVARLSCFDDPALPLREHLHALFAAFLAPLAEGDEAGALHMRIHLREMVEPSSMLLEVFQHDILPHHDALVRLLARHCGAHRPDDDLHMLAFALIAMVNDYWVSQDCMRILAPGVLGRADAVAKVIERLTGYAMALVEYEAARRRAPAVKDLRSGKRAARGAS